MRSSNLSRTVRSTANANLRNALKNKFGMIHNFVVFDITVLISRYRFRSGAQRVRLEFTTKEIAIHLRLTSIQRNSNFEV